MTADTRPSATASCGGRPYTRTPPAVGVDRPSSMSMVVVLPAPFGPSRATTSPGRIRRLIPSTAVTGPNRLTTWSSSTAGPAARVVRSEAAVSVMTRSSAADGAGRWSGRHGRPMTSVRAGCHTAAVEPTESALIVAVPEAEPAVAALRTAYDPAASWGVPAHVTVLYPFLPPDRLDAVVRAAVREAVAAVPAFDLVFGRTRRFGDQV